MHDSSINDETRDRAVRRVLWISLGVAVIPMVAALALVQPTLARLRASDATGYLQDELASGGSGDSLGSVLSRSASGFVRAVQATLIPSNIQVPVPELRPLDDDSATRRRFTSTMGADVPACDAPEDEACSHPALERLRAAAEAPLRTTVAEPASSAADGADRVPPTVGLILLAAQPMSAPADIEWRERGNGVYVADVGGASLTLAGAVALNDFSVLRPINEVGVGGYLTGAPELHHGALSGGVARTFEHGDWRVRPEIGLAASYLDLDNVWLDVGEAGLFLPETEDWVFSARPSLAFEGKIDPAPGFTLTPSLRAGATWLSQTEYASATMMLDAPTRIAGVDATLPVEKLFADVEAGLGLAASERLQLSVRYGRMFGEAFEAQTGRLELNMQF